MSRTARCQAILATQYRHQQPWVKLCEQSATMLCDDVPLCGTHINRPPKLVVQPFTEIKVVEALS